MSIIKPSSSSGISYIIADEPFARGGEGDIFQIAGRNKCVKVYRNPTSNTKNKLVNMVSNHQNLPSQLPFMLCWPLDIIYSDKVFAGFVMDTAYSESISLYELCLPRIRQSLNGPWSSNFERTNGTGIFNRLKICVNLASAVHAIHLLGHCMIDLKPQNILVSPSGRISLIDLDSIQFVTEKGLYHATVSTPEYAPPEIKYLNTSTEKIPSSWDSFSLAVVIYEILFGIHPYAATFKSPYENINTIGGKIKQQLYVHGDKRRYLSAYSPTHNNLSVLPSDIGALFLRSFVDGNKRPSERPSAEEWGKTLSSVISSVNDPNTKFKTHTQSSTASSSTPINASKLSELSKKLSGKLKTSLNKKKKG